MNAILLKESQATKITSDQSAMPFLHPVHLLSELFARTAAPDLRSNIWRQPVKKSLLLRHWHRSAAVLLRRTMDLALRRRLLFLIELFAKPENLPRIVGLSLHYKASAALF